MGIFGRRQPLSNLLGRCPRDHFVPEHDQDKPPQTPIFERLLSRRSRDAAPSGGGPRGDGPRGAAAFMRRDAPQSSRTWHAPSAWRYARVGVPRAPSGLRACGPRAVRRARAVRCARHGGPRRALPQHLLRVAVLDAAGRCRAERRCLGRCASPWTGVTGRLGSRCSLLNAANSWPSRLRSTSQTITLVVLESISLSSLRCATGLCVHGR